MTKLLSNFLRISCLVSIVSTSFATPAPDHNISIFKTTGQPIMTKYNPHANTLTLTNCGSVDKKTGKGTRIKSAYDLSRLTALRTVTRFVDTNVQTVRVYDGFREAYLEQFIEKLLKTTKLYPERKFKGNLLVDEYLEKSPMKWVLQNVEEFRAIKKYLTKSFAKLNIKPSEYKPLVYIQFESHNQQFNEEDIEFLNTYYTLVTPENQDAREVFNEAQQLINNLRSITDGAKNVQESDGEKLIRWSENTKLGIKEKDMLLKAMFYIGLPLVTTYAYNKIKKAIKKKPAEAPAVPTVPAVPAVESVLL